MCICGIKLDKGESRQQVLLEHFKLFTAFGIFAAGGGLIGTDQAPSLLTNESESRPSPFLAIASSIMASSSLRSRVTALAKSWPVDPLRPNVHFGSSIEKQLGTVNYEALSPESLKYAERAVQNLEGIRSGKESSLVSSKREVDDDVRLQR